MTTLRPAARPVCADALQAAYDVLAAGTAFLIARGAQAPVPAANPRVALRWGGNCLKELDRFLAVLLDACVAPVAVPIAAPASLSHGSDVAGRLARHGFASAMPRLRAIARLREQACGDRAMGFGSWSRHDLAIATMGACGPEQAGAYPQISDRALAAIAEFCLSIGDSLRCRHADQP
jgi:hypothetical protein